MTMIQGGDPPRMRSTAYQLERHADDIRRRTASITADVCGGVWWRGYDAERFRAGWSEHEQVGERVARELVGMASHLREEAAKQESISQC